MANKSHFGKGRSTFTCQECGKRTREVGDNIGTNYCELCLYKEGCGNSLSDHSYAGNDPWGVFKNCESITECDTLLTAELKKLGY